MRIRRLLAGAGLVAAVAAGTIAVLLPPRALLSAGADFRPRWPDVRGAFHVHSSRSDGTGSLDEIAAAAQRAGLQFIIVTDHGDGMRAPESPTYRSGVLCIEGVEISTESGHYIALGIPQAPYRLAGHPREVVEDVHRLGGIGIAAHPDSRKPALRWGDWDAPFDGLEWLNADSEWRDELWGSIGRSLLTYWIRPVESLARLLDRPAAALAQWDRLARERRVVGLAGADAHARLGFREAVDPYEDRVIARIPSYDAAFRTFSNHVVLDGPLRGDAAYDAALVLSAVREGHVFASMDGLAELGRFEAVASSGAVVVRPGDALDSPEPAVIRAQIAGPAGVRLVLVGDGKPMYDTDAGVLRVDVGTAPGLYRVEAWLPSDNRSPVPWIVSNPFYVGLAAQHAARLAQRAAPATERIPIATTPWSAEADERSTSAHSAGRLESGAPALLWRYGLAPGPRASQFAAIAYPVGGAFARLERVQLRARADRPMRVWAQLRASTRNAERWGRTFYLDTALAEIDLPFAEFRPIGQVSSERAPLDRVDELLFVVDTLNTPPGTEGIVGITELWLAR